MRANTVLRPFLGAVAAVGLLAGTALAEPVKISFLHINDVQHVGRKQEVVAL